MPKRRTPNFRGIIARPINPWKEPTDEALAARRHALLEWLGIRENNHNADSDAFTWLARREYATYSPGAILIGPGPLASLAAGSVPGFWSVVRGRKYADLLAARHLPGRPPSLPRKAIKVLVHAVNERIRLSKSGRARGVKLAINRLTAEGQIFAGWKGREKELEYLFKRHRGRMAPDFPSPSLCPKPDGAPCFSDDTFFDEAPSRCRLQDPQACTFWAQWHVWSDHFANEYLSELRALIRFERYIRIISRRPRRKRS